MVVSNLPGSHPEFCPKRLGWLGLAMASDKELFSGLYIQVKTLTSLVQLWRRQALISLSLSLSLSLKFTGI